ncbi:MAG: hypothetical protein SGPRY_009840, partial [Prymnesium sp.]
MNYICGALIMYNSEEESFWLLVQLIISARLLDMIFFERNLAPLFRFTLALLVEDQKKLLSLKGADLVARLKKLPKNLTDPNSFLINK